MSYYFSRPFENSDALGEVERRITAWDRANDASRPLHQSLAWARLMAWLLGSDHVEFYEDGQAQSFCFVYPLPLGSSWLYTPRGPLCTAEGPGALLEQMHANHPEAVWSRWDPLLPGDTARSWYAGACPAHAQFHPDSTLELTLIPSLEDILAQMKPKGRYNIRLAEKRGVEIWGWTVRAGVWTPLWAGAPDLSQEDVVAVYHGLARETTMRDGFSGHDASYYAHFLQELDAAAFVLLARYEGAWIAGGLFTLLGDTCTYYYGASGSRSREVMAPYLVQWKAMTWAKDQGATVYDFLGIATPGSTKASDLLLRGVTDFKTKFGGRIVTGGFAWEKVHRPLLFWAIRSAKKLRKLLSRLRGR